MSTLPPPPMRAVATFFVLAAGFAVTIAWSVVAERTREWRATERRFDEVARAAGVPAASHDERGVQQVWMTDLDRVDRCTTCHRGIDHPKLGAAPQPFTAHSGAWLDTHPIERFGCTPCHGGQGEATTWAGAAHRGSSALSMRRAVILEAGCGTCHRERQPAGVPSLAAGRGSIVRHGCVGCHDVPGYTAADVRAPRLESAGLKARQGWLRRYLAKPSLLAGARMPDFRLSDDELDALDAFLSAERATAPLDASRVDWAKADPERGRELYARARCVTCHRIDERGGTTGPDLSTIGSRTSRDWLWSYIQDPFREQPDTLMPRFSLAPDDARDIAYYLSEELTDPDAPGDRPARPSPDARTVEAGRRVFIKRGCFGCHRIKGTESLAKIGPALAGIGDRAVEATDFRGKLVEPTLPNWLYAKLRTPQDLIQPSLMPTFALPDRERLSVVVALLSLTKRELPPSRVTDDAVPAAGVPQGAAGALFTRYRCLSCHRLAGNGGVLSTVALDRIGSQLTQEWLRTFLREPSTVRVSLEVRMPRMGISKDEADLLAEYAARVLVDDRLSSWTAPPKEAVTAGADLYTRLGCQGCHQVDGRGGYVGPDLSGVGRRLQPGWMKAWLLAPARWKAGTTQPDYGLTEEQATALTAYMLTLTGTEARK